MKKLDSHLMAEKLLLKRHEIRLVWHEPHSSVGPEGNHLDAHVKLSASIHDCVNMQRLNYMSHNYPISGEGIDAQLLLDFIAVHWAEIDSPIK